MHRAAPLAMVHVSLAGGSGFGRRVLRLPLEQRRTDGPVGVHGRRREVLLGLAQVEPEDVRLLLWYPLHTGTARGRRVGYAKGGEQFSQAVPSVHLKRYV